jgi:hypothetical protein
MKDDHLTIEVAPEEDLKITTINMTIKEVLAVSSVTKDEVATTEVIIVEATATEISNMVELIEMTEMVVQAAEISIRSSLNLKLRISKPNPRKSIH